MRLKLFSGIPHCLLAALLTLSLPSSSALAGEQGNSVANSPAVSTAMSCSAKAVTTVVVPARPSDNWTPQASDWKDSGIVVDGCYALRISARGVTADMRSA